MKINIDGSDLLKHLTFWHNKTDDECIELATNEFGLDAQEALMNMLERDFCTEANNNIIEDLKKWIKDYE
jgi:hypothetical protein